MDVKQFIKKHREDWKQLEQLVTTMHKRKKKSTGAAIDQFYRLYQKAAQNLSYSQTYFPKEEVTIYLNGLVSKSHNILYKDQMSSMHQVRHFFSTTFIRLLWEQWKFVVAALLLFTIGAVGSYISVIQDPQNMYAILPPEIAYGVDPEAIGDNSGWDSSVMSASIMTNNIQVAILAFAGGITFGLLTVYILVYNGIIIGALAALFWTHGKTYEFWAYIVPHGMIELTAIFIAGGAGLLMGYKLFVPGHLSRGYQLKVNAKRSVQLLLGTLPLFVIAGIIEGFITPAPIPLEAKYFVAFATVLGLVFYFIIGKRLFLRESGALE